MAYWNTELAPWPFRSQHQAFTADNQPSENADLDCGETVAAMICEFVTGVRLDPDTINSLMFWNGHIGLTDVLHIKNFLAQTCSIKSTVLSPVGLTGAGSLTNLIWQYTVVGKPLAALMQFSATETALHWVVVMGIDNGGLMTADPWMGTRKTYTYAEFGGLYRNALLGVERLRDSSL